MQMWPFGENEIDTIVIYTLQMFVEAVKVTILLEMPVILSWALKPPLVHVATI